MPDPTAHADDMKSLAKHETMPSLWWLEPFGFAVSQWNARAEFYKYWRNSIADHNAFQRKVELTLKPVFGDCGYEDTIDLVDWAAEEIKTLRAEKARCAAELLETKETVLKLVAGNERAEDDMTKAEARIKQLTMFCERAGAERDTLKSCNESLKADLDRAVAQRDSLLARKPAEFSRDYAKIFGNHEPRIHGGEAPDLDAFRFGHMHTPNQKPKAKRKPAKKKAKYGDARDKYSAIGRRYLKHLALVQARRKAIAKAKKKGGRRA